MHSRVADLGGLVHYVEFDGAPPDVGAANAPVVLVHGLGGSHVNWLAVAPRLGARGRVVALDLAGFGRTPPGSRTASVEDNQELLDRFLAEVVREPAILIGNSMGGLISIMEAGAHPERVAGLVLVDPAQPRPLFSLPDLEVALRLGLAAVPGMTSFMVRKKGERSGAEALVRRTLDLCCVDSSRIPEEVFAAHVAIAEERLTKMPWSENAFAEATRSILAVLARPGRFRELVSHVRAPTLLVHGVEDRLVPVEASRELARLRPEWSFVEQAGVGHTPQLEDPAQFLAIVEKWLDARAPRPARA